jgi:hypothetical protein
MAFTSTGTTTRSLNHSAARPIHGQTKMHFQWPPPARRRKSSVADRPSRRLMSPNLPTGPAVPQLHKYLPLKRLLQTGYEQDWTEAWKLAYSQLVYIVVSSPPVGCFFLKTYGSSAALTVAFPWCTANCRSSGTSGLQL